MFSNKSDSSNINIIASDEEQLIDSSLSISYMRKQVYRGSLITIEQTLRDGFNYKKYLVSYLSDSLKVYALLTVPKGLKPDTGWPVIIMNHDYVVPREYRTGDKYDQYMEAFSRNRYIVVQPDYRGHGKSEGLPGYPEYTPYYTVDILNAVASVKKFEDADPARIGMWGKGMGGNITLRSLVVSQDIKASSIWAGVVGDSHDLGEYHIGRNTSRFTSLPYSGESIGVTGGRANLIEEYGDQDSNPKFWDSIDPFQYLADISVPIQIQHSQSDAEVPYILSQKLYMALKDSGKKVEIFTYENDNHNLTKNIKVALKRSIDFFDKNLK